MLKKACPSSGPEQRPSKGNRKANFWLCGRAYKLSEIYRGNFFNKSERFFKMHVMELRNGLF
jgi:hypothetical protein